MLAGIVPATTLLLDLYWKPMDGDSEWVGGLSCNLFWMYIYLKCLKPVCMCGSDHLRVVFNIILCNAFCWLFELYSLSYSIGLLIQARANDDNGLEEGYDSSRDEISSVSSYNPAKESIHKTFGSSLSLHSFTARSSNASHIEGGRTSLSTLAPPRLSVAEVLYASGAGVLVESVTISTVLLFIYLLFF